MGSMLLQGIRVYKIRRDGSSYAIGLPKELCEQLGFSAGRGFFAVRAIGRCLVISQVTDLNDPQEQIDAAFRSMLASDDPASPWEGDDTPAEVKK